MRERFNTHANNLANIKFEFESDLRQFLLKNNNSIEINYTDNDNRIDCFYTDWNSDVRRSPITKIYLKGEDILLRVQDDIEELYLFNGDVLTYETSMEILYYLLNLID
jgi:chromosome condensin MukBEF MukE localization factor